MKCLAALLLVLTLAGCRGGALSGFDPSTEVRQHVTFYLKRPGNEEDRARLIAAVQQFGPLPGVIEAVGGRRVGGGPAGASPSSPAFDAVMLLTVTDERALVALESRPDYRAIFDTAIRPLVERYETANSTTERYNLGQAAEKAVEIDEQGRRKRATDMILAPSRPGS